jgi:hypothetical protein
MYICSWGCEGRFWPHNFSQISMEWGAGSIPASQNPLPVSLEKWLLWPGSEHGSDWSNLVVFRLSHRTKSDLKFHSRIQALFSKPWWLPNSLWWPDRDKILDTPNLIRAGRVWTRSLSYGQIRRGSEGKSDSSIWGLTGAHNSSQIPMDCETGRDWTSSQILNSTRFRAL